MTKKVLLAIAVVSVLVVAGIAAYVLRPTPEASAPIEALPLQTDQPEPVMEDTTAAVAEESSENDEAVGSSEQPAGAVVFQIVPEESEVRFSLDELLRGEPTTVIGKTDQVAGEILVDFNAPGSSQVGVILVNARTLVTDNDFRNRAINNEILDTGKYEFITFTPTGILGFPEAPQLGEALSFQIVGQLTIRDVTNEITFDVMATAESETRLSGYASATISRTDYGLEIPEVPSVANVEEEVLLEIDFVALAK